MPWDLEPTSNPSQEGNREEADKNLLPSREGSGVGWFMESLHGFVTVHWDHEPADRAVASWTAPVLWRFRPAPLPKRQKTGALQNLAGLGRPCTPREGTRPTRFPRKSACIAGPVPSPGDDFEGLLIEACGGLRVNLSPPHEVTPLGPIREESVHSCASSQFPSWEGLAAR